jgi:hypothetical protein
VTANEPSALFEYAEAEERPIMLESEYHVVCSADVLLIRKAAVKEIEEKLTPANMKSVVEIPGKFLTFDVTNEVASTTAAPITTGALYENARERVPTESEYVPLLHTVTEMP